MDDDVSYLMMGYLTHKVDDKVNVGVGIFTPFALIAEWPNRWEGKTASTYSYLRTFCVNPVVSIKVHPRLFLAVGIDYLYSNFKLRRVIDPKKMIGSKVRFENRSSLH